MGTAYAVQIPICTLRDLMELAFNVATHPRPFADVTQTDLDPVL